MLFSGIVFLVLQIAWWDVMNMLLCWIDALFLWITTSIGIPVCFSINSFQTKLQGRLARLVMAWMIILIQEFSGKAKFNVSNPPLCKFASLRDAEYRFTDFGFCRFPSTNSSPQLAGCGMQDHGVVISIIPNPASQSFHVVDLFLMRDVGCRLPEVRSQIS